MLEEIIMEQKEQSKTDPQQQKKKKKLQVALVVRGLRSRTYVVR